MEALTPREYRRNLVWFVMIEGIWWAGTTFSQNVNILPVFLKELGASRLVLGVLPALAESLKGLQVFSAYLIGNRGETRRWVWVMHVLGCLLWLPLGGVVLGQEALGLSNGAVTVVFFVMYAAILSMWYIGGAGYWGLMGRSLNPGRRQLGVGLALLTGTTMALVASAGSSAWQDSGLPFSVRFGVAFVVTGLLTTVSLLPVLAVREVPRRPPPDRPRLVPFLRQGLLEVRRNRNLRYYLLSLILLTPSVLLTFTYVVQSGVDAAGASVLMAFFFVGQAAGHLLCGWVGDRWGARIGAATASVVFMAGLTVMLSGPRGPLLWAVAVAVGVFMSGSLVTRFGMLTELSPDHDATHYVGIAGVIVMPFAIVSALGGSYLIGRIGYERVLAGTLACVLMSVVVLVWKVRREPLRDPSPAPSSQNR